jgi:hypothetical protein
MTEPCIPKRHALRFIRPPPTIRVSARLPCPSRFAPSATSLCHGLSHKLSALSRRHRSSRMFKNPASLSCSFGLFDLSGLSGCMRLARWAKQTRLVAAENPRLQQKRSQMMMARSGVWDCMGETPNHTEARPVMTCDDCQTTRAIVYMSERA